MSLKLDCDKINRKNVPEKNKTNPIDIHIDETLYSSFFIIRSYKTSKEDDNINIDSTPVGIESNSFKVPVTKSKTTNKAKTNVDIFINSLKLFEISSLCRYKDNTANSIIVNSL
jgi:hypothetical protein